MFFTHPPPRTKYKYPAILWEIPKDFENTGRFSKTLQNYERLDKLKRFKIRRYVHSCPCAVWSKWCCTLLPQWTSLPWAEVEPCFERFSEILTLLKINPATEILYVNITSGGLLTHYDWLRYFRHLIRHGEITRLRKLLQSSFFKELNFKIWSLCWGINRYCEDN